MTEPDVTLTDLAIALECLAFCVLAARWTTADARMRQLWIGFFASVAAGALFGGLVHGFFLNTDSPGHSAFWLLTLLALGCTSAIMWLIGSRLQLSKPVATWVNRFAVAQFAAYALIVITVDQRFVVAIATYLPATVFLTVAMILTYRRARTSAMAYGITGLGLTFVAAAVQQLKIALHPVYFNHNALYHAIQGIALYLIFRGARWIVTAAPPPTAIRSAA